MPIKVTTTVAPACWASYLVNGDASGLEDEDIAACDDWHACMAPSYVVSTDEEESFIGPFKGLLTDLTTYVLHTIEED